MKKDCKAAQARLCQPSQGKEPLEASAEASSSSREAPLLAPEREPSVEGGIDNKYAVRHTAANLGLNQRGYTKAKSEAQIKDATSGQQTLASAWAKYTAARQACEVPEQSIKQDSVPGSGGACDIIDAVPEPESVPSSARRQGKPKQQCSTVAVKPKHMRNKKATAAFEATSQRKASRNVCDKARDHHPKRKEALQARRAQPNFKSAQRKCAAADGHLHVRNAKSMKKCRAQHNKSCCLLSQRERNDLKC